MATFRYRITPNANAAVQPTLQSYTHSSGFAAQQATTSDATALQNSAVTPDGADHLVAGDTFLVRGATAALSGGLIYSAGNVLKVCVQAFEAHANNNLELQLFASIVSSTGSLQQVIRSKVTKTGELNTSLRSLFFSTTLDGSYTTVANDRFYYELSVVGTPTAAGGVQGHNATIRWGGSGAAGDLLENDTQTATDLNPWIEVNTSDAPPPAVFLLGQRNRQFRQLRRTI